MSAFELMRCIRDGRQMIPIGDALREGDVTAICSAYDLSDAERQALFTCDVRVLTDIGVHPFSLVQLARVLGVDLAKAWNQASRGDPGIREASG
jgi:hypothetical protein